MSTALVWFSKCLRLHDNPALWEVCQDNQIESILPIFILDPEIVGPKFEKYGINRLRFLFENLDDLNTQIQSKSNNSLLIFWGSPQDAVQSLQSALGDKLTLLSSDYCSEPHAVPNSSRKTVMLVYLPVRTEVIGQHLEENPRK